MINNWMDQLSDTYNTFYFNLGISILASDQNADFCHFVQEALHFIGRICDIQSINAAKVLKFQNLFSDGQRPTFQSIILPKFRNFRASDGK